MSPLQHRHNPIEAARLSAVQERLRTEIAELAGLTDDASANLRAALEALLNSDANAAQLQSAAASLIARSAELQVSGASQKAHQIAYVLSEEALAKEQRQLEDIQASLFDESFQADLREAFERGSSDLVEAYDEATEQTLKQLAEIDAQLAEPGLSPGERQALLEAKQAALYAYTGDLEKLLERAEERGVHDIGPLSERVREQREALESSALSPQQKENKLAEATREAALVGAKYQSAESSIVVADATNYEVEGLQMPDVEQDVVDVLESGDLSLAALGEFSPPPETEDGKSIAQLS